MIKISSAYVDRMIQQAREHSPVECCGIIAGRIDGDSIEVMEIFPMTNVDQSPEHFSLDPEEQFKVYYAIRERGLKQLGNYHSHPASPARPSQEDIRLAYDAKAVYMILSLQEETPVLKAFRIKNGEYTEIPLEITE